MTQTPGSGFSHTRSVGDPTVSCTATWIEVELVDQAGSPVPGEHYRLTLPDGSITEGSLDERGMAHVVTFTPGTCTISFPRLDREAWEPA